MSHGHTGPSPTRPRPRSAAADSHPGSDAAAAGPEPAAHLVGARRADSDGAGGLRRAQRDLRRAAGRHRGERSRAGRRSRPPSCPRWPRRASRCRSWSSTRRSRAGCGGRSCDEARRKPKGRRLRYAVGELMTCTRCMGAWSALGLVALRVHSPPAGRTVADRARRIRPATTCCRRLSGLCAPRRHRAALAGPPCGRARSVRHDRPGAWRRVMLRTARSRPRDC